MPRERTTRRWTPASLSGEKESRGLVTSTRTGTPRSRRWRAGVLLLHSPCDEIARGLGVGAQDARSIASAALADDALPRHEAERLGASLGDPDVLAVLLEAAHESKRRGKGDVVTVSRNVFLPLTNLCRNRCTYCTFAKLPDSEDAHTYTLDELADVVRGGGRQQSQQATSGTESRHAGSAQTLHCPR